MNSVSPPHAAMSAALASAEVRSNTVGATCSIEDDDCSCDSASVRAPVKPYYYQQSRRQFLQRLQ